MGQLFGGRAVRAAAAGRRDCERRGCKLAARERFCFDAALVAAVAAAVVAARPRSRAVWEQLLNEMHFERAAAYFVLQLVTKKKVASSK